MRLRTWWAISCSVVGIHCLDNDRSAFTSCDETILLHVLKDSQSIIVCSDKKSMFISPSHLDEFSVDVNEFADNHMVQIEFGQVSKREQIEHPITSCLSSVNALQVSKVAVTNEAYQMSAGILLNAPFLKIPLIDLAMSFELLLSVDIERQVEFTCNGAENETVQVLRTTTQYECTGWRIRSVDLSADPSDEIRFGLWIDLPNHFMSVSHEAIICSTEPEWQRCNSV